MEICPKEIDACDSYMVVLLGNRYGWIPDYRKIPGYEEFGVDPDDPVSVTELEIRHGVFEHRNLKAENIPETGIYVDRLFGTVTREILE